MAKLLELNQYLIREKFWKFFGNKFRIMDDQENLYGFCEQKRFKLKEDLRVYDDEDKNNEWLMIKQKNVVDSWGGFDIFDPKSGSNGFSPGRVNTIFLTDLAIAFSFLIPIISPFSGLD